MKFSFFLAAFFLYLGLEAQVIGSISGTVIQEKGKPVAGATVTLLRGKDSNVIKLSAANKDGGFLFDQVGPGIYLIGVTAAGHRRSVSAKIEVNQQSTQLPPITLRPLNKELAGVTVTAKRPLIEQRIDRTIVNVDASIMNIGATALEVLEKSPGITVDKDGMISLKGKEGVLITVDGRPTQLSGPDLANLLRNMNASQLDQIEIMTNPPARYDAAGNVGIINIRSKKIQTDGYNGTASVTYMQGRYPKISDGLNFNYRNNKINLFGNLGHNFRRAYSNLNIQRNILDNAGTVQNYFDQGAAMSQEGSNYNIKAGLDFFANKNTTFGLILNKTSSPSETESRTTTTIFDRSKVIESTTLAEIESSTDFQSNGANLNFRRLMNSNGRELTADMDYINYGSDNRQFMANSFFDVNGNTLRRGDSLKGGLPQDIKVYSGRLDYVHPLKNNAKFEAGIKSSFVKTDNNAVYDSIHNGILMRDYNRSNHFIYEENINAAYVNLSTALSRKVTAQLGLRLENTNTNGTQILTGEKFNKDYTQLFPTAYLQYKANDKHTFGLNYGRRIRRPDYRHLNPFIRFIDKYTYSQGNPDLRPQFSNNIEVSHIYKNVITTTLNYSATTDIIDNVIEQRGQEAYRRPSNIASLHQYGIAINTNNNITKWWMSNININAFTNRYKGVINNSPVSLTASSYIINGIQQFKLSKTFNAEISGRFRSGWLEGLERAKPIGFVGAGLSKQVLKNKGTLRFTVRDIFHTQKFRTEGKYANVDFRFQQVGDSRVAAIGFTYRFSKGKRIAPVKRTAGSTGEEEGRVGVD